MKMVKTTLTGVAGAAGLFLKRTPAGGRTYIYRYLDKRSRRKREIAIGSVSELDAKMAALRFADQRQKGVDPADAHREAKRESVAQARTEAVMRVTFKVAAESYVKDYGRDWKHRYAKENWLNPIKKYAFPIIGPMLLDMIKVADVRRVTDAARDVPGTARRLRQHIAMVIADAREKGDLDENAINPADADRHLSLRRRTVKTAHYPRVELDAAPKAFQAIVKGAQDNTALAAWAFMILTAARPSEALRARWSEIDLDKNVWTVPAARMKGKLGMTKAHAIPLTAPAIEVLERQMKVRSGDAIFPGLGGSSLSYDPFAKAPGRAEIEAGTPHSWRSVFSDVCANRLRIDRDLREAVLAHKLDAVEGAYHPEHEPEARRAAMEAYARWLLNEKANVIALPSRA